MRMQKTKFGDDDSIRLAHPLRVLSFRMNESILPFLFLSF